LELKGGPSGVNAESKLVKRGGGKGAVTGKKRETKKKRRTAKSRKEIF